MPPASDAHAPWANPWAVCWRRKKTILSVFVIGFVASVLIWKTRPEIFRSSAQLLLVVGSGDGERQESASSVQARVTSHMAQLKSKLVVRRVVDQVFKTTFPDDEAVPNAHKHLKIEKRHNLLKMTYAASSPEKSCDHLREIISGYQGYLRYTPQSNHREAIDQLTAKVANVESESKQKEQLYAQLLKSTPFAGTNRDIFDQIDERLDRLEDKRQGLLIRKAELERLLAAQPARAGQQPPSAAERSVSAELSRSAAREIYALELRERLMSARARGDRPEIRRAAEEAQQARQIYVNAGQTSELVSEFAEIEQSLSALENLLNIEKQQAQHWTKVAVKANRLRKTIDQQEQTLAGLKRQLQRRKLASELEACQLQVIAPPKEGSPRSKRDILLYFLLPGTLGSLFFGLLAGCVVEFIDRGFHSPSEITRSTGAQLMGVLPFVSEDAAAKEHSAVGGMVANYKMSHSEFAEQFRRIRTGLTLAATPTRGQVLLVTSYRRGDGRTVAASNLAAALAQAGKRTLLIDANFFDPQLHEAFKVSNKTGLADILAHRIAWQKFVQPTLLADVDLLTSGHPNGSPTELLSSPQWLELLNSMRSSYDFLIIDGPGLQESLDPVVLANSADQILLVLRVGRTSRLDAAQMLESLGYFAPRIVGVVMNNVKNVRQVWNADPLETYRRMHLLQTEPNYANGSHGAAALNHGERVPDLAGTSDQYKPAEASNALASLEAMLSNFGVETPPGFHAPKANGMRGLTSDKC